MAKSRFKRVPTDWELNQAVAHAAEARRRLLEAIPDLEQDPRLWRDTIEGQTDVVAEAKSWIRASLEIAGWMKEAKAQIANLRMREARFCRWHQAYRNAAFWLLDAAGLDSFPPNGVFDAWLQADGPKIVGEPDPETLPDEFVEIVVTKKVKKTELLDALKEGRVIDGVVLSNGGKHLVVRPT